ncbi:MAG: MotA/TolQ/ExbB proton channel family protein, partial [Chitinophagaceae bacterium]
MFYLLQAGNIVTDTLQKASGSIGTAASEISMWELLQKGGWIMYPLYALFALAVYVFTERLIAIRKASRIDQSFMNIIKDNILSGNISA